MHQTDLLHTQVHTQLSSAAFLLAPRSSMTWMTENLHRHMGLETQELINGNPLRSLTISHTNVAVMITPHLQIHPPEHHFAVTTSYALQEGERTNKI